MAGTDCLIKLGKAGKARCAQHAPLVLAVVAEGPVEGLQREVAPVDAVHDLDAVNVVRKVQAGARVVHLVKAALAGVAEGRVADVVGKGYGLDKVEVESQGTRDVAGDAAHELHMLTASRDVVVLAKREDLRLAGIAVIRRHIERLFDVADKSGAHERLLVARGGNAPQGRGVGTAPRAHAAVSVVVGNLGRQFLAQRERCVIHVVLPPGAQWLPVLWRIRRIANIWDSTSPLEGCNGLL